MNTFFRGGKKKKQTFQSKQSLPWQPLLIQSFPRGQPLLQVCWYFSNALHTCIYTYRTLKNWSALHGTYCPSCPTPQGYVLVIAAYPYVGLLDFL